MTFAVIEHTEDRTSKTVIRRKIYRTDGTEEIEFPGMMELRDRFVNEIQDLPGPSMTENTLKITYGQRENNQRVARERLRRAESGEEFEEQEAAFVLNFEDL